MRWAVILICLPLSGCETTLPAQPQAQAVLVANPACVFACKVALAAQRAEAKAEAGATLTASPGLTAGAEQQSAVGGHQSGAPAPE